MRMKEKLQGLYARLTDDDAFGAFYDGWHGVMQCAYYSLCIRLLLSMFMMHRFMFHSPFFSSEAVVESSDNDIWYSIVFVVTR